MIFAFFILLSFFSNVPHTDIKDYSYTPNTQTLIIQNQENDQTIFKTPLGGLDIIYSGLENIDISGNDNHSTISLTNGRYTFWINDIAPNYVVSLPSSQILLNTPGIVNIEIEDENNISVTSVNSVAQMDFLNNEGEVMQSIWLPPHTSISGNPKRGVLIRGGDIIRVGQVFDIKYKNISHIEDIFFDTILADIIATKKSFGVSLNIDNHTSLFPGEARMEKYASLLINDEKKGVYLTHNITKYLGALIENPESKDILIPKIQDFFQQLKQIDTQKYDTAQNIAQYFWFTVLGNIVNIDAQIAYFELLQTLKATAHVSPQKSSLVLSQIFAPYSSAGYQYIFEAMGEYILLYQKEQNNRAKPELPYILFFLENILLEQDQDTPFKKDLSTPSLTHFLELLVDYESIASIWYQDAQQKTIESSLYRNEKIFQKLAWTIRSSLFEENRDENEILIKNTSNIAQQDIQMISRISENFFDFFEKNKESLQQNKQSSQELSQAYYGHKSILDEMIGALSDYESYRTEYDVTKKQLLQEYSIRSQQEDTNLNIEQAREYLEQFTGIQKQNLDIQIIDYTTCQGDATADLSTEEIPYCYQIKNLGIDNKLISFHLLPFEKNKITNIRIQSGGITEKLKGSYKLDEQKRELDEKKASVRAEEKYKYDFSLFFQNTFGRSIITNQIDEFEVETIQVEDKFIRSFKTTKLFGDEGDFSSISDFLYITYQNVILEKDDSNNTYIAHILNSDISDTILDGDKSISVRGELKSKYRFLPDHSFYETKVRFINPSIKNTKTYLLSGNNIYITGSISIENLPSALRPLFEKINTGQSIHGSLLRELKIPVSEILYSYDIKTQTMIISAEYKGAALEIFVGENGIDISYDKKIQKNISLSQITDLLP
ncbi:hypothetical protein MK079_00030 [Candidatus Gracilibacteria bacterium]|nr:hypothetical protein [Candidatus Gracilibacteria bacterium]